jgi:hypothetical protein
MNKCEVSCFSRIPNWESNPIFDQIAQNEINHHVRRPAGLYHPYTWAAPEKNKRQGQPGGEFCRG